MLMSDILISPYHAGPVISKASQETAPDRPAPHPARTALSGLADHAGGYWSRTIGVGAGIVPLRHLGVALGRSGWFAGAEAAEHADVLEADGAGGGLDGGAVADHVLGSLQP